MEASPTPGRRSRPFAVDRCEILVGSIAAGWFSLRLGRSYLYDESVTVGSFVEVENLATALTRQINFNNHPGTTAVGNVMYQLGIGSPISYRLVSVLAAMITVVALYRAATVWYSQTVGLVTAGALIVNPTFGDFAAQVRGYAPMVCFVTLASIELVDLIKQDTPSTSLRNRYYVYASLAVLFHAYAIVPLACHGLVVLAKRPPAWRSIALKSLLAVPVGLVGYVGVLDIMLNSAGQRARAFSPRFRSRSAGCWSADRPWLLRFWVRAPCSAWRSG